MRLNRPTAPRPTQQRRRCTPRHLAAHGGTTGRRTFRVRRWNRRAAAARRRRVGGPARVGLIVLAVVLAGPAAHAHAAEAGQVLAQAQSVDEVLGNMRNWLVGILAALATVFLTLGGVRYVLQSGDPGEVEKAKQAFKAAAIGYGLAALAPLVVTVLQSIVGL